MRSRLTLSLPAAVMLAAASVPAAAQSFLSTTISADANLIWRDYNTNGVPSSGIYNPKKSDLRQWGVTVGNGVSQALASNASGSLGYASQTDLCANTTSPTSTMATVFDDGTSANDGVYIKTASGGSACTGAWDQVSTTPYGLAPTWSIGMVTGVPFGTTPTASVGGTAASPTLSFTIPQGPAGFVWRGAWSSSTTYAVNDAISRDGVSYIAVTANTDQDPTSSADWNTLLSLEVSAIGGLGTNVATALGQPLNAVNGLLANPGGSTACLYENNASNAPSCAAPDSTLLFSGGHLGINLGNANTWTASIDGVLPNPANGYSTINNGYEFSYGTPLPLSQQFGSNAVGLQQTIVGTLQIASGDTAGNAGFSIAGYGLTNSTSTGAVGLFGAGLCAVTNCAEVDAMNGIVSNAAATQSSATHGHNFSFIAGSQVNPNIYTVSGGADPTGALYGYYLAGGGNLVGPLGNGFVVDQLSVSTGAKWNVGFEVYNGAAVMALSIGAVGGTEGSPPTNSASQPACWNSYLSSTANQSCIATDDAGDFVVTPAPGAVYSFDMDVTSPSTDAIRLANNQPIVARNAAGNADLSVVKFDSGNNLELGASGSLNVMIGSPVPPSNGGLSSGISTLQWSAIYSQGYYAGSTKGVTCSGALTAVSSITITDGIITAAAGTGGTCS